MSKKIKNERPETGTPHPSPALKAFLLTASASELKKLELPMQPSMTDEERIFAEDRRTFEELYRTAARHWDGRRRIYKHDAYRYYFDKWREGRAQAREQGKALAAMAEKEAQLKAAVEKFSTVFECSCKKRDAWKCAVDQNSSELSCKCSCHKTLTEG